MPLSWEYVGYHAHQSRLEIRSSAYVTARIRVPPPGTRPPVNQ